MAPKAPNLDHTTRAAIIALRYIGRTAKEIHALIPRASIVVIYRTWNRAIERGFDPNAPTLLITLPMVEDAPRCGIVLLSLS